MLVRLCYFGLDLVGFGCPLAALCFCLGYRRLLIYLLRGSLPIDAGNRIGAVLGNPIPNELDR